MRNRFFVLIIICVVMFLLLIKKKCIQDIIVNNKLFDNRTCKNTILQQNFYNRNSVDSEIEHEFNYDYKKLLERFNLDEKRFFHMPFVSYIVLKRWVFHGFANHIYANGDEIIYPNDIICGDIIYVKTDFLKKFVKRYHQLIKNPYILITHQSDMSVGIPEHLDLLNDRKIIKWFGQNVIIKHPKLEPIPIGIVPPDNQNFSIILDMANNLNPFYNRSTLLYLNFSPYTNKNRSNVLEYFKNAFYDNENVIITEDQIDWPAYLSHLGNAKFVLSPPGNGIDCHRTWETLAMGAVPIVLKSELQPLYDEMPVMVVDDWTDVTEANMEKFSCEKLKNYSKDGISWRPKLWLRYWITKIMNEKTNFIQEFC